MRTPAAVARGSGQRKPTTRRDFVLICLLMISCFYVLEGSITIALSITFYYYLTLLTKRYLEIVFNPHCGV